MKRLNKKGFTMAELLIVVAIIAVLVAIAIPVFTSQLEKAKEATDLANIRAAYAEASVAALDSSDGTGSATTDAKMVSTGDIEKVTDKTVAGQVVASVTNGKKAKVTINADGTYTLSFVD